MNDAGLLIEQFLQRDLNSQQRSYLEFHRRRFLKLVELVTSLEREFLSGISRPVRVLDVGASFQTLLLSTEAAHRQVETVGFRDSALPDDLPETHHEFDLNLAQNLGACPRLGPYDLVVFCEVLEHLHTAPSLVFACIAGWMDAGGLLILQTPNAVRYGRRKQMLLGQNPADPIREDTRNPAHFREYTAKEIRELGAAAGLDLVSLRLENYFGQIDLRRRLHAILCRLLPVELEEGITAVFRKPA